MVPRYEVVIRFDHKSTHPFMHVLLCGHLSLFTLAIDSEPADQALPKARAVVVAATQDIFKVFSFDCIPSITPSWPNVKHAVCEYFSCRLPAVPRSARSPGRPAGSKWHPRITHVDPSGINDLRITRKLGVKIPAFTQVPEPLIPFDSLYIAPVTSSLQMLMFEGPPENTIMFKYPWHTIPAPPSESPPRPAAPLESETSLTSAPGVLCLLSSPQSSHSSIEHDPTSDADSSCVGLQSISAPVKRKAPRHNAAPDSKATVPGGKQKTAKQSRVKKQPAAITKPPRCHPGYAYLDHDPPSSDRLLSKIHDVPSRTTRSGRKFAI